MLYITGLMEKTVKELMLTCETDNIDLAVSLIHKHNLYKEIKRWLIEDELGADPSGSYAAFVCYRASIRISRDGALLALYLR